MCAKKRSIGYSTTILFAALALATCGDDPTGPANPAQLAIRLTDAPIQNITSVTVHIEGLKVKRVGEPEHNFAVDVGAVDLLTLQNSTMLLATATVEAGEYEYIMVELDQDRSSVTVDLAVTSVRIPSEKIKVFGPFQVAEDGTTTVTLDFDAAQSLRQLGNGDWLMTPIIVMLGVESS